MVVEAQSYSHTPLVTHAYRKASIWRARWQQQEGQRAVEMVHSSGQRVGGWRKQAATNRINLILYHKVRCSKLCSNMCTACWLHVCASDSTGQERGGRGYRAQPPAMLWQPNSSSDGVQPACPAAHAR